MGGGAGEGAAAPPFAFTKWDAGAAAPLRDAFCVGPVPPSLYESVTKSGADSERGVFGIVAAGERVPFAVLTGQDGEDGLLGAASMLASKVRG